MLKQNKKLNEMENLHDAEKDNQASDMSDFGIEGISVSEGFCGESSGIGNGDTGNFGGEGVGIGGGEGSGMSGGEGSGM